MSCTLVPHTSDQPANLSLWLRQQLTGDVRESPASLFALIDIARLSQEQHAALPEVVSTALQHHGVNLYADLEGTILADAGPRLCLVGETDLNDWALAACSTHLVHFMAGDVSLADLAEHLQSLREVTLPGGSQALFRFQDCHVTTHLWPLLTPSMGNHVLGPLLWWATPDICGPWHVLSLTPGYRRSAALRFDRVIYDRLNDQLLVYTVADQVREVDAALLNGMSACQVRSLLRARLDAARRWGLVLQSDLALYAVLSLQLPEGFEHQEPFANAVEQNRRQVSSFGAALDRVTSEQWTVWNDELANQ